MVETVYFIHAQHEHYLTQTKISDELYYSSITDSIFMITHYFPYWGGNSLFVLLAHKKGLLIDTPFEITGTSSLLDWTSENYGELELTAIVTGFHQDNLGGNDLLISKGINVYGADLTKKLVIEEGDTLKKHIIESVKNNENKKYYKSYSHFNLVPPNKIFPIHEELKLEIENEIVEVYFPGESHTVDNTVVYLYKNKILFGGCMIKGYLYNTPGNMEYANMNEWPKSVEKVIQKFPDCQIVVPGHGDYGGKDILDHTLEILEEWNKKNVSQAKN